MAQKRGDAGQSRSVFPFELTAVDFTAQPKKRMEGFAKAQVELFENWQETNRQWLEHVQVESNLASQFASKLTASRSFPEALTAYQDWITSHFELMAEGSKHLLDETQKFIKASAHVFAKGWQSSGSRKSA